MCPYFLSPWYLNKQEKSKEEDPMRNKQSRPSHSRKKGVMEMRDTQSRLKWGRVRLILRELLDVLVITDKVLVHILLLGWSVISILGILRSKIG
jgi:hypothetical protein